MQNVIKSNTLGHNSSINITETESGIPLFEYIANADYRFMATMVSKL